MKITPLLFIMTFVSILFSCDTNTRQKGVDKKTIDNRISSMEDSIKKVKMLELDLVRQDSIEASQIKGYSVKRLSGRHKYGGVTKVEYYSLTQLIDELKEDAEKQMWPPGKLETSINSYKSFYKGGLVRLYIERITIGAANTEYFSIIIKDLNEDELYRVELDSDIPSYSSDNWWNYGYVYVNKKIKAPFYVYVIDRLQDAPFKFEVTPTKK